MQHAPAWLGRSARRVILITGELIDRFAALSGDLSPIHMTGAGAQARGFEGRVAHGLLLGSLISSVIGNELPGADGVLQKVALSFRNPCYEGDEVTIDATVCEFFESVQTMMVKIKVTDGQGRVLVTGTVQTGLRPQRR